MEDFYDDIDGLSMLGGDDQRNAFNFILLSAVFKANSGIAYHVDDDGSLVMSYAGGFPSVEDFEGRFL